MKLLIVLTTLIVCLAMLEVGLRVMNRYPLGKTEGYQEKGGISYVLKKNFTKTVVWPSMSFTVHTSDMGFRAKQPGPQAIGPKPYYAVLGASDAFGNGLDYENTFVGLFAEKMARHNVDVVNLAVAGHHLLEQSALFKQFTSSVTNQPQAVIVIFNPNLIGGYDDIHSDVVIRKGEIFEKEHWRSALFRMVLGNSSGAYCFFRDAFRRIQQRYFVKDDVALSFWVERLSSQHPIKKPERTADFREKLRDLDRLIRGVNAKPIYVYCPPAGAFSLNDLAAKGKVDPGLIDTTFFSEIIRTHCADEGIEFVNFEPPVQERFNKGEKLNFDGDGHYNAATSRTVGDYLYEALRPDRVSKH